MKKDIVKDLNGYILIYCPEHKKRLASGYVYEHILVAEKSIGRELLDGEVVHHLDGNRANNHPRNLLVLFNSQHAKLHSFLRAYKLIPLDKKELNEVKGVITTTVEVLYCLVCGNIITGEGKKYCSHKCDRESKRRVVRPPLNQLLEELNQASFKEIGRKYGVSDMAIRKWLKNYGMSTSEIKSLVDMSKISSRCLRGEYVFSPPNDCKMSPCCNE